MCFRENLASREVVLSQSQQHLYLFAALHSEGFGGETLQLWVVVDMRFMTSCCGIGRDCRHAANQMDFFPTAGQI